MRILLSIILFQVIMISTGFGQTKLIEKVDKSDNDIVIPYEKYELSNGLTLILHEDHSDPLIHIDITYHVGSAREEIKKSGFVIAINNCIIRSIPFFSNFIQITA